MAFRLADTIQWKSDAGPERSLRENSKNSAFSLVHLICQELLGVPTGLQGGDGTFNRKAQFWLT